MRPSGFRLAESLARLLKAELYTTFITPFYFIVVACNFGYVLIRDFSFRQPLRLLPHDQLLKLETIIRAQPTIIGLSFSLKRVVAQYPAAIMVDKDPISPQVWPLLLYLWATRGQMRDVSLHCYQVDVDSSLVPETRYYTFEILLKLEDSSDLKRTARHLSQEFLTIVTPALRTVQLLETPRINSHFYLTNNSIYARTKSTKLPMSKEAREAVRRMMKKIRQEDLQEKKE